MKTAMKKSTVVILAIVAVLALILIWGITSYNGLVNAEVAVDTAEADLDVYLQRRADLIPNLVSTVKGYTAYEGEVYTELAEARAKLAGSTTAEDKFEANAELDDAISRLLVVVENYPELKADTQYTALMDELSGAENRIATARKDYNTAVQAFNTKQRRFPTNIIAGMFGFEKAPLFEASEGADTVPSVNFD